jgi:predicted transcriptional regulator
VLAGRLRRRPILNASLAVGHGGDYLVGMDPVPPPAASEAAPAAEAPETEAERDRLGWEADGIAEARAELAAGLYVDAGEMPAWIDSLCTDHPPPTTRHR